MSLIEPERAEIEFFHKNRYYRYEVKKDKYYGRESGPL